MVCVSQAGHRTCLRLPGGGPEGARLSGRRPWAAPSALDGCPQGRPSTGLQSGQGGQLRAMGSYLGTSLGDAGSWGLLVYLPLYRNRISDWEGSLAKVTLKFSGSPRKRTQAPHSQPPKGLAGRPPRPFPAAGSGATRGLDGSGTSLWCPFFSDSL